MLAQGIKTLRTAPFNLSNDARGKVAAHCVIVGFGLQDVPPFMCMMISRASHTQ